MARSKPSTTRSNRQDVTAAVPSNGKLPSQKKPPNNKIREEENDVASRQLSELLDPRDVRMEKAWQLLSGKKFSVSQVAEEVGYTNLSAFSKAFKKYYNITARERSKENAD